MKMRSFLEFQLDKVEGEFILACESAGLDPKQALLNELLGGFFGRMFGQGQQQAPAAQPQQQQAPAAAPRQQQTQRSPNDQGVLLASPQGATHFANNQQFAKVIQQEVGRQLGTALSNSYKTFLQQYPDQQKNQDKVKKFFNALSQKLNQSLSQIISQASVMVDGDKMQVGQSVHKPAPTNVPLRQPQPTQRRPAQLVR